MLHESSLLLDDIEEPGLHCRGQPTEPVVFGVPQTVNQASSLYVSALEAVRKLQRPMAIDICLEELDNLHQGKALDLSWSRDLHCPTEEEYLGMVDKKTAGLITMMLRLLMLESTTHPVLESTAQPGDEVFANDSDLLHLGVLIGRYYQLRDDLFNATSPKIGRAHV